MASNDPRPGEAGAEDRGVSVDAITALGTALSRPDGRVATLADRAGEGPLLVVVVDRRHPVCRETLGFLAGSGARLAVISQGRVEAAGALLATTDLDERDVLVEPAPHPVSDALAARTVPTFALVASLELVAWQDGWDRDVVASLVHRAGGHLDDRRAPRRIEPRPSRLELDDEERGRLEADDAALVTYAR